MKRIKILKPLNKDEEETFNNLQEFLIDEIKKEIVVQSTKAFLTGIAIGIAISFGIAITIFHKS